jgi:hypothetical protein
VEDIYMRYLLMNTGALDLPSLVAFLVVALIYFLAPAAGYSAAKRGVLLGSLWVLVGKMGIGLFRGAAVAYLMQDRRAGPAFASAGDDVPEVLMLFSLLELAVFLFAMVLFVGGLANLRRREDQPPPGRRQLLDD